MNCLGQIIKKEKKFRNGLQKIKRIKKKTKVILNLNLRTK